jgi:uncharacterized protein YeaC (DUF1315 family)
MKTLESRFWEKVNKEGPTLIPKLGKCWEWTSTLDGKGYGRIGLGRREQGVAGAHRVAWFLETGKWPSPCALHKCDNPLCVRFSHLFEGDHQLNADDKVEKGRCNSPVGKNNGRSKLTMGKAREIHRLLRQGVRQSVLALKYGVHKKTVWQIKVGITWVEAGQ